MATTPRVFWDNGSGSDHVILTMDDFTNQDWENLTGQQLMDKLPAGMDMLTIVNLLVHQVAYLSKKSRRLESEIVDKIILEDKSGS